MPLDPGARPRWILRHWVLNKPEMAYNWVNHSQALADIDPKFLSSIGANSLHTIQYWNPLKFQEVNWNHTRRSPDCEFQHFVNSDFGAQTCDYSFSLKHPLRYKQWLLKHEMSSLHEIDCFLCFAKSHSLKHYQSTTPASYGQDSARTRPPAHFTM